MRLDFDLQTDLSPEDIYSYFRTPHDWPRLFTAFGPAEEDDDGWVRVRIRHSPFALSAKNITTEENQSATWDLRGFWKGRGEIHLTPIPNGTQITGFEKVSPPRLLGWGGLFERWAAPSFAAVWESGWRQIRRNADQRSSR